LRPWRWGSYCEPCCATTQSARRVLAMRASIHAGWPSPPHAARGSPLHRDLEHLPP